MTRIVLKPKGDMIIAVLLGILSVKIYTSNGDHKKQNGIIYVVWWTQLSDVQLNETEHDLFVRRNCSYQNCYITVDKEYFSNVLDFDVLLFNAIHLSNSTLDMPANRSEYQKYVLQAIEPANMHVIKKPYINIFNLTWTYKLNSDATIPYIVIKNKQGEIIGPKTVMHWMDVKDMKEVGAEVKKKLRKKKIAAMWFVSHCKTNNHRELFVRRLQQELAKYNQRIDVFGACTKSKTKCPNDVIQTWDECYELIETTYYFYLAFENSFSEDYVTEKLLTALENYAVPVVYGGANYTRFMPDGIYLNARILGPARLAQEMARIINNKQRYYGFFKWRRYYEFHNTNENRYRNEICGLCELLNNRTVMEKKTTYDVNEWWNERYDGSVVE